MGNHLDYLNKKFAKETASGDDSAFTLNDADKKAFDKTKGAVIVVESEGDEDGIVGRLLRSLSEDTFIIESDDGVKYTVKGTVDGTTDDHTVIIGTSREIKD